MSLKSRILNLKSGFTLIELLVVISIIGIIVTVGAVSYQKAVKLSRDSKRKTDLEQIRQALETYKSENFVYPLYVGSVPPALSPDYMTTIPTDPKTSFSYSYSSDSTTYVVCASLENGAEVESSSCTGLSCGTGVCNYYVTHP